MNVEDLYGKCNRGDDASKIRAGQEIRDRREMIQMKPDTGLNEDDNTGD